MEQPNSSGERLFGKYRLIQKVGVGGFGEVWKAQDTIANRVVALKILHQGLMSDEHFIDKAKNEARLIGKLDHPNIVKVYEVSQIEGRLCIAMEFIDGQPLSKLIQSGERFNFQQIVNIIEQVGAALEATHAKKIVHRDVKPENILVDPNGNIHLVDFGLAYAAMSSLGQSSKSIGMGTAMYMSPEQAAGQPGGPTADIYSLGVIAYELLAGQPPFKADTLMGYMMAHQKQQPPDLIRLNPSISKNVQAVILKSLEKKPEKRFKTASAFVNALQKAGDASPRSGKTRNFTCGCIGLVIIVLIAVGVALVSRNGLLHELTDLSANFNPQTVSNSIPTLSTLEGTNSPKIPPLIPTTSTLVFTAPGPSTPSKPNEAFPTQIVTILTTTVEPTSTSTLTASDQIPLVGTGVRIISIQGNGNSTKGKLIISIQKGDASPLANQYVNIYTQKKDLSGNWVIDQRVNSNNTDNSGSVEFELDPGHYIVASDFHGYNWGTASDVKGQADVPVDAGLTTQLTLSLAQLNVGFLRGDKSVIENQYVQICTQKRDLAGNWVTDQNVASGSTDNTGAVSFILTPGYYIIYSDFTGYNWGNANDGSGMANLAVPAGQTTQLITNLGQLIVGLVDSNSKPINGKYVEIKTQKKDVSGKLAYDKNVTSGTTDNSGQLVFNLTSGNYAIKIDDNILFDVMVQSGKITITNGSTSSIEP
jgi:serine/threonine protein kinase